MKRNGCSISNLTRNNFVLYFSTKKGMRRKNYSLWMVIFFKNIKEWIIPHRSLVTIHTHSIISNRFFFFWGQIDSTHHFILEVCAAVIQTSISDYFDPNLGSRENWSNTLILLGVVMTIWGREIKLLVCVSISIPPTIW